MNLAALLISLVAVGISAATLYFTHIRKKVSMVGCLVRISSAGGDSHRHDEFEYSLSNTGNQELVVRTFFFESSDKEHISLVPFKKPYSEDLPVVVGPRQVKLVTLTIPLGKKPDEDYRDTITFDVLAPNGERYFMGHNVRVKQENTTSNTAHLFAPFRLTGT